MGLADAAVPIAFFSVSVFAIAQSAIAVKAYLDTNKEKDASFYFSTAILTISIIALLASGFMALKAFKGGNTANASVTTPPSAIAGSQTNAGGQPTLTQALAAKANGLTQQAARAENAANAVNTATMALARAGVK
jgi:hypothetical protein